MISHLPVYLTVVFILTTILTILLFTWVAKAANRKVTNILLLQVGWLVIQGVLALSNVYNTNLNAFPPKLFLLGLFPSFLFIAWMFLSKNGRAFIDGLSLYRVTLVNIVRIPVEIGLFRLFLSGIIPQLMTFEGGNLDIISGLTAPIIAYYGFKKHLLNRNLILAWNFICLGLLINIVTRALLSAPFPFQQLAFNQPNIAILHFPFVWLPTYIVPVVLFGHLVSIRQLLRSKI